MKGISGLYFSEGADKIDDFTFKRMMRTAEGMKVQTFDSYCLGIVKSSPGQISKFFRFEKETLTHSASIVENESLNKTYFRRFLDRFLAEHASEYGDLAALAYEDPVSLYKLLERLMARGIIPLRSNGETSGIGRWFGGNDGKDLLGDTEGLRKMMEGLPLDSNDEKILKDVLSLEGYILKTKDPEMLDRAAFDSRETLLRMIHDVYYEFIRTSVADDRLTFGLAASFAFIILYEDKETRERIQCRYLIVDEYKDNKLKEGLENRAKSALTNFKGRDIGFISRENMSKIDGLNETQSATFINSIFENSDKSGYVILGDKIAVYKITDQKLPNFKDISKHEDLLKNSAFSIKNEQLIEDLLSSLQHRYKIEQYYKGQ